MIGRGLHAWRRRWWLADPATLARFEGLTPIKVVIGGSDGIGKALASELYRSGDFVLLVARNAENLARTAADITATAKQPPATGSRVAVLALDVTAPDALDRLDAELKRLGGYCDLLVNSAGTGITDAFIANEPKLLDDVVALNVAALTRLCRHYLPDMLGRGRGGILNVASLAGYAPGPYQSAYYASKAYVISLTEAIGYETAGHGVRIAALSSAPVRTALHERMGGETGLYLKIWPVWSAERVARRALRRFRFGQRAIIPGLDPLLMISLRFLPRPLLLPILGVLLKPRRREHRR